MKYSNQLLTALSIGVSSFAITPSVVSAAPYVNLQVGVAKGSPVYVWIVNEKKTAPSGRIGAGIDWGLSPHFKLGLETGVQGYERKVQSDGPVRVSSKRLSYDGFAVADFYLSDRLDLTTKLGAAYVHPKDRLEVQQNGTFYRTNLHSVSFYVPKAAAALGYEISGRVKLSVTLSHELARNHEQRGVTSLMGGIQLKFC